MKAWLGVVVAVGIGAGLLVPPEESSAPSASASPAAVQARHFGPPVETRLKPAPSGHFHTEALVNGQPVEFVVDTGASTIALTVADARRIGIPVDPSSFVVVGTGASGPVRGQNVMIDSVTVEGKEVRTLQGAVIEGLDVSLLGQAYLSRIGEVRMAGGEMILR
jgi:aspartyl protease family protein